LYERAALENNGDKTLKLAVASGKGGSGKSTVAANLAYAISLSGNVTLVDCDVEEPNLHLYFPSTTEEQVVTTPVPVVDDERCTQCGRCGEFCRYGALAVTGNGVLTFLEMCHSCGGCMLICPEGAIHEVERPIGRVTTAHPLPRLTLITGILNEGEVLSPRVIRAAKEAVGADPVIIYDSSPGTACPVIETLEGCDACILVTESTPFGLHDLRLAVEVAGTLGVPAGVIINRSDGKDAETRAFCDEHGLPVLMTIPFDRGIASLQGRGELFSRAMPEWQEAFGDLYRKCRALVGRPV